MSSLIGILLRNCSLFKSQNLTKVDSKIGPVVGQQLGQVISLIYELIEREKYELLETIMGKLKRQQEVYEEKRGKQAQLAMGKAVKLNRPSVMYEEVLNGLSLRQFVDRLSKEIQENQQAERDECQQQEFDAQLRSRIEYLMSINHDKLIGHLEFFVDFVFSCRRILAKQVQIMQLIIVSLKTQKLQSKSKSNSTDAGLSLTIQKWQMMLKLAKQSATLVNLSKANQENSHKVQQKAKNQQLDHINTEWLLLYNNDQTKPSNFDEIKNPTQQINQQKPSLLSIYQSLLAHHNHKIDAKDSAIIDALSTQSLSEVLPKMVDLYKTQSLQNIQSELQDILKLLLPQFNPLPLSDKQTKEQTDTHINNSNLVKSVLKHASQEWAKLKFLETTLQYFLHQLNTIISDHLKISKSSGNSEDEPQQQNTQVKTTCLQQIVSKLTETYCDFLVEINQILKQWLQNDIKNNYYLSQESKIHYMIHLLFLANWISPYQFPSQNTISNQHSQSSKEQYLSKLIQRKSLDFVHGGFGKHFPRVFSFVNEELKKIAAFLSTDHQGAEQRLLSEEEYLSKVQGALNQIASNKNRANSIFIKHQNQSGCDRYIDDVFCFWFVNQSQFLSQSKLLLSNLQDNNVHGKDSKQSRFVQLSYKKLSETLFKTKPQSKDKSFIQSLLQSILNLHNPSQFLENTFQFHSPTFNQQYLTFNYIYGDPKDIYFYQNHHYSHILLTVYQTLMQQLMNDTSKASEALLLQVFDHLRNGMGNYAKAHLVQANSKTFYEYLNLFKFTFLTFTRRLLYLLSIDELVLMFDLILHQIIVKENHPLIRQYIQVLMARIYFTIKERVFDSPVPNPKENERTEQSDSIKPQKDTENSQNKQNVHKFYSCRRRMISMLEYDEQNLHNLNIGVPILMILGYELISYLEQRSFSTSQHPVDLTPSQQSPQESDSPKIIYELDIHLVLVKYIACHVAYSRAICQYYMSKFLALRKKNAKAANDALLVSLAHFWFADKDSVNIMRNISVAVEGFKVQIDGYLRGDKMEEFYLGFERVEEYPQFESRYFLLRDTIQAFETLINSEANHIAFQFKVLLSQKLASLKRNALQMEAQKIQAMSEQVIKKSAQQQRSKKPDIKKQKNTKDNKKYKQKSTDKKSTQIHLQTQQLPSTTHNFEQIAASLNKKLQQQYRLYQSTQELKVIIIATLLQKVHNFGYLVRTLTSRNAMLVVPTGQPFLHPECKQLLPPHEQIDVKVIEIKPKYLQSFIRMYQHRGYPLIALEQCSKSIELQKTVFPEQYMLLLGNQRIGAPASLLEMANILVQIPQIGKVRSLNVHVSMVICFWEYLKQVDCKQSQKPKAVQN